MRGGWVVKNSKKVRNVMCEQPLSKRVLFLDGTNSIKSTNICKLETEYILTTKCGSGISCADAFFTHSVIRQLDVAFVVQKHIVQFQITVNDA